MRIPLHPFGTTPTHGRMYCISPSLFIMSCSQVPHTPLRQEYSISARDSKARLHKCSPGAAATPRPDSANCTATGLSRGLCIVSRTVSLSILAIVSITCSRVQLEQSVSSIRTKRSLRHTGIVPSRVASSAAPWIPARKHPPSSSSSMRPIGFGKENCVVCDFDGTNDSLLVMGVAPSRIGMRICGRDDGVRIPKPVTNTLPFSSAAMVSPTKRKAVVEQQVGNIFQRL